MNPTIRRGIDLADEPYSAATCERLARTLRQAEAFDQCTLLGPMELRELVGIAPVDALEVEQFSALGLAMLPAFTPEGFFRGVFATDHPEQVERVADQLRAVALRFLAREKTLRETAARMRAQRNADEFRQLAAGEEGGILQNGRPAESVGNCWPAELSRRAVAPARRAPVRRGAG